VFTVVEKKPLTFYLNVFLLTVLGLGTLLFYVLNKEIPFFFKDYYLETAYKQHLITKLYL